MILNTFLKSKKGFTLIEVVVSITLCLIIVLIVSYSLKFFIGNYNKNKNYYLLNQKYLFLNNMLNTQYKNVVPFKSRNKYFIKGNKNFLVFLTSNSATYYPGLNEVGYFYNEEKKKLNICFANITKSADIVDYEVLKDEGKCTEISDINKLKFKYLLNVNDDFVNEIDGVYPIEINVNISLSGFNEEILVYTNF